MKQKAKKSDIRAVLKFIIKAGLEPVPLSGRQRTVIATIGDEQLISKSTLSSMKSVSTIHNVHHPYKLASKQGKSIPSKVRVGDIIFGGKEIIIIAGPCTIDNLEKTMATARAVKRSGAKILRGGVFKPRTEPYAFQGLQEKGLKILSKVRKETGLKIITEVMDPRNVKLVAKYSDIIQVGTRSMQNYALLKEVGLLKKPVLLKRGMSSTYEELLLAAEYIMSKGNREVILCERGIRTFENYTRNTLDISAIPSLKELTHLPIIVDPSHGTGKSSLVPSMAKAAVAANCDGLMIEVHVQPEKSLVDADQTISTKIFSELMKDLKKIALINKRRI